MQLDAWTTTNTADAARRKRLTIGYAVGAATVGVALYAVTFGSPAKVFQEDETMDVALATLPETEAPPPEPEPEPEKPAPKPKRKKRNKKLAVGTPDEVPDDVPDETDPTDNPYGEDDFEDAFGGEGGGGLGEEKKKPVLAKKAPPPPPAPPKLVSEAEGATRPRGIAQPKPAYPDTAREQGVEATVIVRFLVSSQGSVSEVKVLRGHPLLNPAVIVAVQTWRFAPATYEGRAVAMWQTASFPFRLKS